MMLVIGRDDIAAIRRHAVACGFSRVQHWSGRKPRDVKRVLPTDTRLVLVFVDCVNHNLVQNVKRQVRRNRIPVIFSDRGERACEQVFLYGREVCSRAEHGPRSEPAHRGVV